MTFFERYASLCQERGIKPSSLQAADMIGINKATIAVWKKSGQAPKAETVAVIADVYGVSTDWLLGRTDDPTDYANPDLLAELAGDQLDEFGGNIKMAVALQKATAEDVKREATPKGVYLYSQLDEIDRGKAEGYMQGLLSQDKYTGAVQTNRKKRA